MTIDYYKMLGVKKPTRKRPETIEDIKEALNGKLFKLIDKHKYGVLADCIGWLMARHDYLTEENKMLRRRISDLGQR